MLCLLSATGGALCGCQHEVLVRSWPSGATVQVDDDTEGQATTPMAWSEDIGPNRPRTLKLTLGDEEREVVVDRNELAWPSVALWTGAGLGACATLTAVGWAGWGIALAATDGEFAPFFPGVMMPVAALALGGGVAGGFLYGRQGPSEIMVDFEGARVVALPGGGARWKGEPPAPLVLEPFATEGGGDETTEPAPQSEATTPTPTADDSPAANAAPSEASDMSTGEQSTGERSTGERSTGEVPTPPRADSPDDKLVDESPSPLRF